MHSEQYGFIVLLQSADFICSMNGKALVFLFSANLNQIASALKILITDAIILIQSKSMVSALGI
ncbi:hypothetical protein D3C73_1631190 [compost metagenome]